MKPAYITDQFLASFIQEALREDIGDGDHSSLAAIPEGSMSKAQLIVKDNGVIAGVEMAEKIFHQFDPFLTVEIKIADGKQVKRGDIALMVSGPARSILSTERVVLNTMQRMSGIATMTNRLASFLKGTNTQLLDTRKTTPNFRLLEKWAVAIGGGTNHRIGLYDMIMLKDNHIDMAGGIAAAVRRTREYLQRTQKDLKIEIETRTLAEVREVLSVGGVDIIMLDNMELTTMKEAIRLIDGKFKTEASGGITEDTIRAVAECGVDYISVGALTHSFKSLDLSLKAIK